MASVLPYERLRATAAAHGVGSVMVEHRGIGLSRTDGAGRDLPVAEVTVEAAADDLAAVLDHLRIERVVVDGSSYGTYLAQVFGVRHPHRVAGWCSTRRCCPWPRTSWPSGHTGAACCGTPTPR